MGRMLTVPEVADRLGMSGKTIYAMVAGGELPGYKFRNSVRVDEEELEAYVRRCRVREPQEIAARARAYQSSCSR